MPVKYWIDMDADSCTWSIVYEDESERHITICWDIEKKLQSFANHEQCHDLMKRKFGDIQYCGYYYLKEHTDKLWQHTGRTIKDMDESGDLYNDPGC